MSNTETTIRQTTIHIVRIPNIGCKRVQPWSSLLRKTGFQSPSGRLPAVRRHCIIGVIAKWVLSMSQAIVDPIELRRFAQNLKKFNQELEERLTSLRAQLHSLGATWRDQEHKKFTEDFEEHMKVIARYIELTNEHAPFLLRKAERIEEYLQQR